MSPYEIRTIFLYLISIRDSLSENKKNYNCKYELKYFAKSVVLNKKNIIPCKADKTTQNSAIQGTSEQENFMIRVLFIGHGSV